MFLPKKILNFRMRGTARQFRRCQLGVGINHGMTIGERKYFFCHAGINVNVPLEEQKKTYLVDHPQINGCLSCVDILSGEFWQSGTDN